MPHDKRACLPRFAGGWLTFECDATGERGRLTPIPPGWEDAPESRLLLWARVAIAQGAVHPAASDVAHEEAPSGDEARADAGS